MFIPVQYSYIISNPPAALPVKKQENKDIYISASS